MTSSSWSCWRLWILVVCIVIWRHGGGVYGSLISLPPKVRVSMGDGKRLERDCLDYYFGDDDSTTTSTEKRRLYYRDDIEHGYQVAASLFQQLSSHDDDDDDDVVVLWFPKLNSNGISQLQRLVDVLSSSTHLHHLLHSITASTWPNTPAPCIQYQLIHNTNKQQSQQQLVDDDDSQQSIQNTKDWVNTVLGKYKLCPYTANMNRGAVGLESRNVSEGPVQIKYVPPPSSSSTNVIQLMSTVWDGILQLATQPESVVSTLLIISPHYDTNLQQFIHICDTLLEPSIQATNANDIIGKAWFHPLYQTQLVYTTTTNDSDESTIKPGHALPPAMVQTFINQYYNNAENQSYNDLTLEQITNANNQIRHTPHATINLLRRSQLKAAKDMERNLPNPRPNAIYARNVIKLSSLQK